MTIREPVKKKKCGKFHIWGGGPDPGIFHIKKKKSKILKKFPKFLKIKSFRLF